MTEPVSHPDAYVSPTSDLPVIKSTSCDCPDEGIAANSGIFGDILANVALEPTFEEGETSDKSSGEACGTSVSTCVPPTGLPQAMTQLIASLSLAASAGSTLQASCVTPTQSLSGSLPQASAPTIGEPDEEIGEPDEDLRFESPDDMQFASCRRPAPNSQESPVGSTSGFSSRLGAAEKGTVAVHAIGDAALPTGMSESATGHVATGEQEVDNAIARNPDFALRSTVDTMSGILGVLAPEPTLAPSIHVTGLETYLPAMIVRTAVELTARIDEVGRVTTGMSQADQPGAIRVKILTFDLHPAALGPLTVRMRTNGKQIEIAIEVRTEEVRAILTQTREAMIEALAGHGLSLETPDIRLATSSPSIEPKQTMQDQSAAANAGGFLQDQGHDHHDRRHASTRHGSPGEEQPRKARGALFDADKPMGIYL